MMSDRMQEVPGWHELSLSDRDEVWRLISLGKTVTAILYYRQASGLGLAEAKEAVELLLAYKPRQSVVPETRPCPHCGRPLRTAIAQQCFSCGADWHEA